MTWDLGKICFYSPEKYQQTIAYLPSSVFLSLSKGSHAMQDVKHSVSSALRARGGGMEIRMNFQKILSSTSRDTRRNSSH